MKLHAVTSNSSGPRTAEGYIIGDIVPVTRITTWIGTISHHTINPESLASLLKDAGESGRMTISSAGVIDGLDKTPLYTAGQRSVKDLYQDGDLIWNQSKGIICKSKQRLTPR